MTDATTPEQPRTALLARIPALLEQHAGHESWGENDGRLDSVLLAWGLNPTDFMESLLGWGYTIAIEAQARPAALDMDDDTLDRLICDTVDAWGSQPGYRKQRVQEFRAALASEPVASEGLRAALDALWDELLLDACASDGPIRDNDVRQAIAHYRPRIEAEAREAGVQDGLQWHADDDKAEAQAPAVASEGLRGTNLLTGERPTTDWDAGRSAGALDVERLARLTWEAAEDANDYEDYKARLVVAYDAERQGES